MSTEISAADLLLPHETAATCDPTIDSLLALLREGKTDEVMAQIALIEGDIVHTIGRRVGERLVQIMVSGTAVATLAILASGETTKTILQNEASKKELLEDLEAMFLHDYKQRSNTRRAADEARQSPTPIQ